MTGNSWRFIDTGPNTGAYNMQYDELLARDLQNGTGSPTLRLYRWRPWTISVGFNQDVSEIDVAKCAARGFHVVRRPTGGRAILHAEELTYSVVMIPGRSGVLDIYNRISRALVKGLQLFGVEASLQKSQPNFPESYKHPSSIPCFTSSARYEIEWQGRKLVGSAQRRFRDGETEVVLQHGSILTGPAHRHLVDCLSLKNEDTLHALARELEEKTVDLKEICGREVDLHRLAGCVTHGFELEWGIRFSSFQHPLPQPIVTHA